MAAIIASSHESSSQVLQRVEAASHLGPLGGFLASPFGLALSVLSLDAAAPAFICRVLLPSLLVAPVGFCDRILAALPRAQPVGFQAFFYGLQALSALGHYL